jgi:hypothetical protein
MKIHIEIDELVLEGFEYHDNHQIRIAMEQELLRLAGENGLSKKDLQEYQTRRVDAGSFNISSPNMTPKAVGGEIARSIYALISKSK